MTVSGETSNGVALYVTVVELTIPDSSDIEVTAEGMEYVRDEIILNFENDVTLEQIADYLADHGLTQVGMIYRPRIIQARIDGGGDPFDIATSLEGDDLLEAVSASLFLEYMDVASESYPEAIRTVYNAQSATFSEFPARNRYHHFAMHTYAGHRLVEKFVVAALEDDIRVAILDSGLGNGESTGNNPPEFEDRVRAPTDMGTFGYKGRSTITELVNIPDIHSGKGHGTGVAALAAGEGRVCLGTGKHVNIRPFREYNSSSQTAGAIEIAAEDINVRVINVSSGSYRPDNSESLNRSVAGSQDDLYREVFAYALSRGKIIVIAAGNSSVDPVLNSPASLGVDFSSGRDRLETDPNVLVVSGTEHQRVTHFTTTGLEDVGLEESAYSSTNHGSRISLCAPAHIDGVYLKKDLTADTDRGTSLSAPLVAGLAAEMILLDRKVVRLGTRSSEMTPHQIVRIMEATADDMGDPGWDQYFGHGRINVWKALLAVVNGGLSSAVQNPEWYGFEVRATLSELLFEPMIDLYEEHFRSAQLYIDNHALTDAENYGIPSSNLTLFKRVPSAEFNHNPIVPIPNTEGKYSDFLCTFSATRDEWAGGSPWKKLQLRRAGVTASDPAFFEMPLRIAEMKNGSIPCVRYDDYVFSIQVPRVNDLKSPDENEDSRTITVTEGDKTRKYPIGAAGDLFEVAFDYPGFTPTLSNCKLAFPGDDGDVDAELDEVRAIPQYVLIQINTIRAKGMIPEKAKTGILRFHNLSASGDTLVSFSALQDFIVPRVVGVQAEGLDPGDRVDIAIDVPHFTANLSNTWIKFSGSSAAVRPTSVSSGASSDVTQTLETQIPDDLQEGPIRITISVDNQKSVDFYGEGLTLSADIDYSGTLKLTQIKIMGETGLQDMTPVSARSNLPTAFTLHKTSDNKYFIDAPIENLFLNMFGPTEHATLDQDSLRFLYDDTVTKEMEGTTAQIRTRIDFRAKKNSTTGALDGKYRFSMELNRKTQMVLQADVALQKVTSPATFIGTYAGRATTQQVTGSEKLLEQYIQSTMFGLTRPVGFVEADGRVAFTLIEEDEGSTGSVYEQSLRKSHGAGNSSPRNTADDDYYQAFLYQVGKIQGSTARFQMDVSTTWPPDTPDPQRSEAFTFEFSRNGDLMSGQVTADYQGYVDGNPASATVIHMYSGKRIDEKEDEITITSILPEPESGFPETGSDNSLTLTEVRVSYNYVSDDAGSLVLRAFKNGQPSQILWEVEVPVSFIQNRMGIAYFPVCVIPNVDQTVTSVSIVAGIRPATGAAFVVESVVLTYSR